MVDGHDVVCKMTAICLIYAVWGFIFMLKDYIL